LRGLECGMGIKNPYLLFKMNLPHLASKFDPFMLFPISWNRPLFGTLLAIPQTFNPGKAEGGSLPHL
jgi:hypothetical protein